MSQSGPVSQESSPQKIGGTTSPKASPNRSPRDASASSRPSKQQDGGIDVERLRAAAAAELTHEEVKPIQSDFHFFAKENAPKYRALAEEEVRKSLRPDEKLDPLVINTNLNSRLKLAWENLTNDERDAYMIKEEEDRRRFMEEDEIASRHCATLTARGKSPRTPDKVEKSVKSEERQESETFPHTTPNRESSPSPKSVATDQEDELDENKDNTKETLSSESNSDPDESCVSLTSDSPKKRSSSPKLNGDSQLESPTKRNRQLHETKI